MGLLLPAANWLASPETDSQSLVGPLMTFSATYNAEAHSAEVSILWHCAHPVNDDQMGCAVLRTETIRGDDEASVKRAVAAWQQQQMREICDALGGVDKLAFQGYF